MHPLFLPRFTLFETLIDLVTARAPEPPAMTGRPIPNLVCVSLAFRVRVAGGGGTRVDFTSDGAGPVSLLPGSWSLPSPFPSPFSGSES